MDPAPVYYAVVGGVGTLLGVVGDLLGVLRWWTGTVAGLVGAWAFTWLTALDDVRHPVRSVRLLWGELQDPAGAWLRRARLLDPPFWAPPVRWGGDVTGWSSGKQRSGGLFSAPRYRFGITWAGDGRQLTIRVEPDDRWPALQEQLTGVTVTVDGVERSARLMELDDEDADWILQVDDLEARRLVVTGLGLGPEDVELVRVTVDELLERWPKLGRS